MRLKSCDISIKESGLFCFTEFLALSLPIKVRLVETILQTQVDVVISVQQFCGLVRKRATT